jgi:hypothetical protein
MNGSLKKYWDFTSGNERDRIENATHNTFAKLTYIVYFQVYFASVLWAAFSLLSSSLFLLKSTKLRNVQEPQFKL